MTLSPRPAPAAASFVLRLLPVLLVAGGCLGGGTRLPSGARHTVRRDDASGFEVHELVAGEGTGRRVSARIVPEVGGRVLSLSVDGVELLHGPGSLEDLPGVAHGIAILFPTPGLLPGGELEFEGRSFRFPRNAGDDHAHGLVHSAPWRVADFGTTEDGVSLTLRLDVREGHAVHEFFPYDHGLEVVWTLEPEGLRAEIEVENRGRRRLPAGLGLLGFFRIIGDREAARITVPAPRRLVRDRIRGRPTGELQTVAGGRHDLRGPRPLGNRRIDGVWTGLSPERPVRWEPGERGLEVVVEASDVFTHARVLAAPDLDALVLGPWTSAPDAAALWAGGHTEAAQLVILEPAGAPGDTLRGTVRFRVAGPAEPEPEPEPRPRP